jgi:FkbM family methyltransferase
MHRLIVESLRWACEADRAMDKMLFIIGLRRRFYSTKGQDRWIIKRVFPQMRGGYFVEVGAGDGRTHSNTYSLERDYGWTGVAIEANPDYIPGLNANRACHCIHSCVDREAGEIDFFRFGHMGGIIGTDTDNDREKRGTLIHNRRNRIVRMQTSTLWEILQMVEAPCVIDYLSIDVEGAEYRVLSRFPFDLFSFKAITVERPTTRIHALLTQNGYVLERVHFRDGFYLSRQHASELEVKPRPFYGMAPKAF